LLHTGSILFSDKKSLKAGFFATLFVGQKKKENLISNCKTVRCGKSWRKCCAAGEAQEDMHPVLSFKLQKYNAK